MGKMKSGIFLASSGYSKLAMYI